MFKTSKISIKSKWDFKGDLHSHQNLYSITESGMLENIFLTCLQSWRKGWLTTQQSIWIFKKYYKTSKTSIQSNWDLNRDFQSHKSLHPHHRIWDAEKHLLHLLLWAEEKDHSLLSNKSENSRGRLKRLKHLFNQIENSTETSSRIKAFNH